MALTKRVEVLFEPEEYRIIERLARSRGVPVAVLVRKAVEERYLQADLERRRAAVDALLSIDSDLTWDEAKKFLDENVGRKF